MPCKPLPEPPAIPALGGGLSIAPPALPEPEFDPELCCKILPFEIPSPPIPLPPLTVNPATAAVLTSSIAAVQAFIDQFAVSCPRE